MRALPALLKYPGNIQHLSRPPAVKTLRGFANLVMSWEPSNSLQLWRRPRCFLRYGFTLRFQYRLHSLSWPLVGNHHGNATEFLGFKNNDNCIKTEGEKINIKRNVLTIIQNTMMSMRHISIFFLFFIVCAIFSCQKSEKVEKIKFPNGSYLLIEYYGDGEVKSKSNFASNGLQHGETIQYHPNGNIRQALQYKMGEKDGGSRGYHSNGYIDYVGSYKKNQQDSTWIWYNHYNNSQYISFIENYKVGVPWGGQIGFIDSTGKFLNYSLFGPWDVDKVKLLGKIEKNTTNFHVKGTLGYVLTKKHASDSECYILVTVNVARPDGFDTYLELTVSGKKVLREDFIISNDYSVVTYGYFIESCAEPNFQFVANYTVRDDKGYLVHSEKIDGTILTTSSSQVFLPAEAESSNLSQ
jgi:antitoxin component YwqK of YwqJK toxin-antitoxin module